MLPSFIAGRHLEEWIRRSRIVCAIQKLPSVAIGVGPLVIWKSLNVQVVACSF